MEQLAGAHVLVLGAERTGRSLVRFLRARDVSFRVAERSPKIRCELLHALGVESVPDDTPDLLAGVDVVVPSPGVPRTHPVLQTAVARGTPVWSEIELAARYLTCPVLAVTGTNGKSTTTTLLGAMCAATGLQTFVGGNLGTPLIEALLTETLPQLVVAEISSFQLEWVDSFRADVAVMLNLTPDHLDRYRSLEEYGAAKAALIRSLGPDGYAVLNRDDEWVWALRDDTLAHVISFGFDAVEFGAYLDGRTIVYRGIDAHPRRFSLDHTRLQGRHNDENILAAVTAACVWNLPNDAIHRANDTDAPLPHRLAFVRERGGARYFDDSKGTNLGAVEKSLQSFAGDVILLLGGYDKGGDFRAMAGTIRERVRHVVAFGGAGPAIAAQLDGVVPISVAPGLDAAVAQATRVARQGDVVLLSPGCASFDEFRDYVERGNRFRALVEGL